MSSPQNIEPVEAKPVEPTPVTATVAQPPVMVVEGVAEDNRIGICRRCRQQFVRKPGVHDGMAQYYRCESCEEHRLADIIIGSCTIS